MKPLPHINLPIIEPKLRTIKVKVTPSMLPMFATICPVDIIGSEKSEDPDCVVLVLAGNKLPKGEWGTVHCERDGCKSIVTIHAING